MSPGTLIGECEVVRELGRGSVGVVYEARHPRLGRVALKVLRRELLRDAEMVSRFFTEAVALGRIGHDHIVRVLEEGLSADGQHYYAMELLEGQTLAQRLDRTGALPVREVLGLGVQVADALVAAHAAGVIHRDLKPDNLFLVRRDDGASHVKVLDFGLAKLQAAHPAQQHRTRTGSMIGSPLYMSPEQCKPRLGPVGERSDIYMLGIVLYEMTTGTAPFNAANLVNLTLMHLLQPFPALRAQRPDAPAGLESLLCRACAKAPADRPASMAVVKSELSALLQEAPGPVV
jgi:serine/threonine protein kinase